MKFLKGLFKRKNMQKKSSFSQPMINFSGNSNIYNILAAALQNPYVKSMWINTCIDKNTEKVAEIIHYAKLKKRSDGSVVNNDPIYDLFFENPNESEDSYEMYKFLMHQFYETGNAYIRLIGSPPKTIIGVEPIFSSLVEPIEGNMSAGEPRVKGYKIYDGGNKNNNDDFVPYQEMIHVKAYNPLTRIVGDSKFDPLHKEIRIEESIAKWMIKNFDKDVFPNLVVNFGEMYDFNSEEIEEDYKRHMQATMSGPGGSRILALSGGQDVKVLQNSPADMKLAESENAIASKIATYFGIPAELLGPISKQTKTLNNYKVARQQWVGDTIFILAFMLVRAINRKVYKATDRRLDLDRKTIPELQPDNDDLSKMTYATTDEKRALKNMDKLEGENGNKILVPGSMMFLDDIEMQNESQEVEL